MLVEHRARVLTHARHWRPNRFWYYAGWIFWTIVFWVIGPLKVRGTEHVPTTGPVILVSNHISGLDPFALARACPRWPQFLAKEELLRVPFIGYIFRQWGAIPIDRAASDMGSARAMLQVVRAGEVLAIFPEGTRSRSGELQHFRSGAVNLALKRRVPVVPAAVIGSNSVLPKGAWIPRRHPIRVIFGPPVRLWELLPDEPESARAAGAKLLHDKVAELLRQA